MSGMIQVVDAVTLAKTAGTFRAIANVLIDTNSGADQTVYTIPASGGPLYIVRVIWVNESGTIALGVAKMGFNAAANNVITTQAFTAIATVGQTIISNPISSAPAGLPGEILKVVMSSLSGAVGAARIIVEGLGG